MLETTQSTKTAILVQLMAQRAKIRQVGSRANQEPTPRVSEGAVIVDDAIVPTVNVLC